MEPWFHLHYPELAFRLSRPSVPSMRADAERNKKLIVQAAREVFATAGLAASIDEIAERAGVGTGTLYRHFPTKEALFEAIVIGRVEDLVEEARRLIASNDPKTAFFQLLSQLVQHGDGFAPGGRDDFRAVGGVLIGGVGVCGGALVEEIA